MTRVRTPEARRREYEQRKERYPERLRRQQYAGKLKQRFGISIDEFEEMVERQRGLCAICGSGPVAGKTRLSVDHEHSSERIRGLLCYFCNLALGWFADDRERLRRARLYLEGIVLVPATPGERRVVDLTPRQRTHRKYHLKRAYGLSLDGFETLGESQCWCCAICHRSETELDESRPQLCVDHCHETNEVRGLLCNSCNVALGHLKHDPVRVDSALTYLEATS